MSRTLAGADCLKFEFTYKASGVNASVEVESARGGGGWGFNEKVVNGLLRHGLNSRGCG